MKPDALEVIRRTEEDCTCPRCGGIQTYDRRCFGHTYEHWTCTSCQYREESKERLNRFARQVFLARATPKEE